MRQPAEENQSRLTPASSPYATPAARFRRIEPSSQCQFEPSRAQFSDSFRSTRFFASAFNSSLTGIHKSVKRHYLGRHFCFREHEFNGRSLQHL